MSDSFVEQAFKQHTEQLKARHADRQRRAFKLREEGLSFAVIAQRLGITSERVRDLLKGRAWKEPRR